MNNKQLRGTRLGSISHESEEGVDYVETQLVTFRTEDGEEFSVTFMVGVDLPYDWKSPRTSNIGRRLDSKGNPIVGDDPNAPAPLPPTVTHWEQLMKRRTIEELEVILAERIAEGRANGEFDAVSFRKSA
jgi:hypothetical protein